MRNGFCTRRVLRKQRVLLEQKMDDVIKRIVIAPNIPVLHQELGYYQGVATVHFGILHILGVNTGPDHYFYREQHAMNLYRIRLEQLT